MLTTLKKTFKNLGLDEHESTILLCLFENGAMKVRDIAKETKINRTTAYGVLKKLLKVGLISFMEKRGVLEYQSIAPNLLLEFIERRRAELMENKDSVASIMPQLIRLREKNPNLPKMHFFEGVEGVKQAYEDTLDNNKGGVLYDLTGMDAIYEVMDKEWAEYYLKKRKKLGIKCFDITLDTERGRAAKRRDAELLRITKLLPPQYAFKTEVDIYDNKVAIFSFSKEPIAVIIEDQNIADTMKQIFKYMDDTIETVKIAQPTPTPPKRGISLSI